MKGPLELVKQVHEDGVGKVREPEGVERQRKEDEVVDEAAVFRDEVCRSVDARLLS